MAIAPGSNGATHCFYTYGNGVSAPLVDFEVTEGKALGGEQPLTVSNLVMRGTYYPYNGASYLVTVLGRYSPKSTSGGFPKVTLGDATHLAPTLDLSDLSSTYDGISREISFASDAAVAVEIGVRNVRGGDRLVSWQTKPDSTVKFTFVKNGETVKGRRLVVEGDGLYVGKRGIIISFH